MLTFCKLNMAVLYNSLVKFIVSFFFIIVILFFIIIVYLFIFFPFPGILSRYMTGDCKFYVYTCKYLI